MFRLATTWGTAQKYNKPGRLRDHILQSRIAEVKENHKLVSDIGSVLDCPDPLDDADSDSDNALSDSESEGEDEVTLHDKSVMDPVPPMTPRLWTRCPANRGKRTSADTKKKATDHGKASIGSSNQESFLAETQPHLAPKAPIQSPSSGYQHSHRRVKNQRQGRASEGCTELCNETLSAM
mmetsp:Transcript_6841/g.12121  ORF Transcript_6841/g.12121 Transcript_6841/m.12121 type:complete len:180 (+) Transcript_6841:69-608(+)|eukprot:CAMPEP_0197664044 /NCGR_PEP_ID=MMETSP1338-20131121/58396_1 /TAXON_ID=43686 ORGANISM="Pelagodinium beii, Strain RCC1491" /NCGR_SAMPLE_ID=MMETSP1338 /ASSEMBLY_ACC=CAM_ASM_000754 /LENGTH=179 /DNA_ID=CAMNT_0043242601 /DNA_START=62 /DNA_END=601 /DNA_ORIENTATION=-